MDPAVEHQVSKTLRENILFDGTSFIQDHSSKNVFSRVSSSQFLVNNTFALSSPKWHKDSHIKSNQNSKKHASIKKQSFIINSYSAHYVSSHHHQKQQHYDVPQIVVDPPKATRDDPTHNVNNVQNKAKDAIKKKYPSSVRRQNPHHSDQTSLVPPTRVHFPYPPSHLPGPP